MANPSQYLVESFGYKLMIEHGLIGWTIKWDDAAKRAGQCSYDTKTISMSRVLLKARGIEHTKMTMIHEVAHALTRGAKHGPRWKAKFIELGGDGKRCFSGETIINPEAIKTRYKGVCPNGHVAHRHRATKHMRTGSISCVRCNPNRFDDRYTFVWYDEELRKKVSP